MQFQHGHYSAPGLCVLLCFIKPILGNRYVRSRGFIVSEPRETHPRSPTSQPHPVPPLITWGSLPFALTVTQLARQLQHKKSRKKRGKLNLKKKGIGFRKVLFSADLQLWTPVSVSDGRHFHNVVEFQKATQPGRFMLIH